MASRYTAHAQKNSVHALHFLDFYTDNKIIIINNNYNNNNNN